jgi:selenide, water dikinase
LLYDPQTSGGLLVAADPGAAASVEAALRAGGVMASRLGTVGPTAGGVDLVVKP